MLSEERICGDYLCELNDNGTFRLGYRVMMKILLSFYGRITQKASTIVNIK